MRILALDIGEKRCGIAVSDATGTVAHPLCTLNTPEVLENSRSFRRILEDYEPALLICGLPVSLSGVENQQAGIIREKAERIAQQADLPLEYVDERLSSNDAQRILRESGHDERSMRGKVDMIAATLILQTYLGNQSIITSHESH